MGSKNEYGKKINYLHYHVGCILGAFNCYSANVALPAIGREFNAAPAVKPGYFAMLLTIAMTVLPIGRISDLRQKNFVHWRFNSFFFLLFVCNCQSIVFLIIFRALQGLGGAMVTTTVVSIVTAAFPASERGKALGINVASTM